MVETMALVLLVIDLVVTGFLIYLYIKTKKQLLAIKKRNEILNKTSLVLETANSLFKATLKDVKERNGTLVARCTKLKQENKELRERLEKNNKKMQEFSKMIDHIKGP